MTETLTLPNGRTVKVVGAAPAKPAHKPKKYGNRYCIIGGERFDSEREGRRHLVLLERQKRGEIADLKRQVTFKLYVAGALIGSVRPDWTYIEAGKLVADDCKGYQTKDWRVRWKLARALYPLIEWRTS